MSHLVSRGRSQEQSRNTPTTEDRLRSAMSDFKFFCQFWAPVMLGGQKYLTTSDQPYCSCDCVCLNRYREISSAHMYRIGIEKEDQLGPPGRVFLKGWPEFSSDLIYYSTEEYQLREYVIGDGVMEYCALPVFAPARESLFCLGVIEILLHDEDEGIRYASLQVLNALQEVGLTSKRPFCFCLFSATNFWQARFGMLCEKYSLLMARAWTLCTYKYPGICKVPKLCVNEYHSKDGSKEISLFLDHCNLLREGQGLVGKAFASRKSCFCKDITQFSLMDYPFMHYARNCKLSSCFAIVLRSIDPEFNICILELFLERKRMCSGNPGALLQSILDTMAPHLHNFKIVTEGQDEQGKNLIHEVRLFSSCDNVDYFQVSQRRGTLSLSEASENERDQLKLNSSKQVENVNASHVGGEERQGSVTNSNEEGRIELERKPDDVGDGITYELVKQQFGRKLEVAARSFKVSRSTFKRKLRILGISRWPSHKTAKMCSVEETINGDYPTEGSKSNTVPKKGESATDTAMQDQSTMIIKATYGDDIIKFPLSFSSGIEDLKCEIEKRLKLGSYIIKYKDEDSDWILMACNADLHYSMQSQKELGKNLVQLLLIEN